MLLILNITHCSYEMCNPATFAHLFQDMQAFIYAQIEVRSDMA